jgi:hypothetical protein
MASIIRETLGSYSILLRRSEVQDRGAPRHAQAGRRLFSGRLSGKLQICCSKRYSKASASSKSPFDGDPFERPLTWPALIQRTGETVPKRRVSHRDGRDDLRGAASLATAGASIIAQDKPSLAVHMCPLCRCNR